MGIFDISTQQKSYKIEKKDEVVKLLKEKLSTFSKETESTKSQLIFRKFKPSNLYLYYDLIVDIKAEKESFTLSFEGELQNVWILVVLIVLGILFTYGFGLIIVVLFTFLQKKVATKYIESTFEEIKKEINKE
ncbi:hypothetical protein [Halarcobacter ebronensis]|uniref:Uncharacterized protein n=1 Tax=Halarcobacter ebronensis TaxID=1462615 RepID=A0A4Q1AYU7_9BACT|nr:hypothetical protein [Halarcobacter ebronensis]QKF80790.1 hypothetical protein AEBR_0274 [Halarcobacter ebronensis]RXK08581.1 hypothetical protein CRV07_01910 [Halarcobacter ebronensis]